MAYYRDAPPLRADPFTPDGDDGRRVEFARRLWHDQDAALLRFSRMVEENCRMIFSDQWIVWSPLLGRHVSPEEFLPEEQRLKMQRPVVNRLLFWYMLTHSRLTENPPVLTFRPGPDRKDAILAEAADTIHKVLWEETGMLENNDLLMSWLIPGGEAYLKSRVDPRAGDVKEFRGPAQLPLPDGGELTVEDAPYDAGGNALVGLDPETGEPMETGAAYQMNEGGIAVDVLSPLECRGSYDNRPWHKKTLHMHDTYLSPEEVYETFGVEVEPDTFGLEAELSGELQRLMFGSGNYGSADSPGDLAGRGSVQMKTGLVRVRERWFAPCDFPGMQKQTDPTTGRTSVPGGRLLITTKTTVLRDGPRPAAFKYTSPIRRFQFLGLPGRPRGSTPQEALNPLQRQYNRAYAQVAEHTNLLSEPIMVIDQMTGLDETQITNDPGQRVIANIQPNVPPIMFVAPPPMGPDTWRYLDQLLREMQDLGNIEGAEGRVPTPEASGQLVKELRFNSDRFIGPTLRRAVMEYSRMAEDWLSWVEVLWNEGKILNYTGTDNIAKTVTVLPELFTGKVNIQPDLESMLPEGRGERQARAHQLWLEGAFGDPMAPPAIRHFLEISRFPHMSRASQPGGIHRVTAQQENGKLVQGIPADDVPVFPWYDHITHLEVHEEFMSSPEFLELDPLVMQQFVVHRELHTTSLMQQMAEQYARDMAMAPAGPNGGSSGTPGGNGRLAGGVPSPGQAAQGGSRPPADTGAF